MADRDGGLRPLFHKNLRKGVMWVAVETWAVTGGGVPDSWYVAQGGASGWVEFKVATPRIRVRPEQAAFLARVCRMGGRAFVAVRAQYGALDELRLYRGSDAPALAQKGINAVDPVISTPGGPRRWDWHGVASVLSSELG